MEVGLNLKGSGVVGCCSEDVGKYVGVVTGSGLPSSSGVVYMSIVMSPHSSSGKSASSDGKSCCFAPSTKDFWTKFEMKFRKTPPLGRVLLLSTEL